MSFVRATAVSFVYGITCLISSVAQQTGPFTSLAELRSNAPRFVAKTVTVRCHYSQLKGLPMIFDSGHTAVLPVVWSDQIRNTPQYEELSKAKETDWLVFTGHLSDGNFIINDGQ